MELSVITTTYNGLPFLSEAIESVLGQTLVDFEYIIVDDGSTDATSDVVGSISDSRLRYIRGERMGRAVALNLALREAQGRYVANIDADDWMLPQRLASQKAYLDANPDVGMVGSAYYLRYPDGSETEVEFPLEDAELRRRLYIGYPFIHSAVMYRRDLLARAEGFDESMLCAIDYEACTRVALKARLANLPDLLVVRRVHDKNYFIQQISPGQYLAALSRTKWRYWKGTGRPLSMLPLMLASTGSSGVRKWMQR